MAFPKTPSFFVGISYNCKGDYYLFSSHPGGVKKWMPEKFGDSDVDVKKKFPAMICSMPGNV